MFSTGDYTVKQLADFAYGLGVRNEKGGKRGWQAIKNILLNPLYAGFVSSKFTNGERIKGLHQPLIAEKTYFRIVAIVNGDIRKQSKHAEMDWPLRG